MTTTYQQIKADILAYVESVRAKMPEAAEYMTKHLVFDDEKETFFCTADGRLILDPTSGLITLLPPLDAPLPSCPNGSISREIIEETWARQCSLPDKELDNLVERFTQEQPALGEYLCVCDQKLGREGEDGKFMMLILTFWEAATRALGRKLKPVKPKALRHAEATYLRMLRRLDQDSEFAFQEAVDELMSGHRQRDVLRFAAETVISQDQEVTGLAADRRGSEMLWIITAISCLDAQLSHAHPRTQAGPIL
jgi:hypothetical protein